MASSCAELQTDSVPKLKDQTDYPAWRDSVVFILKAFNCWKIIEGTESEPTRGDIKNEDHGISLNTALSGTIGPKTEAQSKNSSPSFRRSPKPKRNVASSQKFLEVQSQV